MATTLLEWGRNLSSIKKSAYTKIMVVMHSARWKQSRLTCLNLWNPLPDKNLMVVCRITLVSIPKRLYATTLNRAIQETVTLSVPAQGTVITLMSISMRAKSAHPEIQIDSALSRVFLGGYVMLILIR